MVYGLYVLSPVIGLLTPSLAEKCRQLDASVEASGPHDFAVREARAFVSSAARVHRIPPHGCDDHESPLWGDGTAANIKVIWVRRQAKFGNSEFNLA
jgi:hypothetical protein